ncbi:uncharacterized protein N7477_008510 [Penicillium maclennaniae]|uniref:uncharacterized protein n=1 Tax=Penicillium maclennaniae TaxID=1343394 RepID=UPI002541FB6A|nr:uncharacterized protein N7477_008510 [Penicillium maclennaniae]KAJ5666062.1 hypothetical protein N7477_008510 [Penicillium maclennaniae]
MSFFTCPWLRKLRTTAPSEVARSDQTHAEGASQQDQTQGPLLSGFDNIPPLSQKQLGNFTHMLRRRFSRESKTSNEHRDSGKFSLPFSLKARSTTKPGTELMVLEDIGSSLMSERGYDSDARDIPTPTRANHMAASPAAQGFRRMELIDLMERSQEREESERWTTDQSPHKSDSRDSPLGMHYIPTPKSSLRGAPHPLREANSQHPALEDERTRGERILQMGLARSQPNMNVPSRGSGPSISMHSPALVGSNAVDDVNFIAHWDQYLRRGQRKGMTTSGSLPNWSTDALVAQRRQPGTAAMSQTDLQTDLRALHLGDLKISHRLASQTMSSGSISRNPSSVDLARYNRHGQLMSSSHENLHPRQRSPQGQISRRGPSSFYSQQSSHPSSRETSPRVQSLVHIERPIQFNQGTRGKPQSGGPITDNGSMHGSRFREHCDATNAPPQYHGQPHDPNHRSPRRISAGWMSGGRRVGYGYSPVSAAEDAPTQHQGSDGHPSDVAGWRSPIKNDRQFQSPFQDCRMGPEEMEPTIKEPRPIPPPMNPKRHETVAATIPHSMTSPHSAKDYPMPPDLPTFMDSRYNRSSLDYETGAVWVDESNPPSLRAPELLSTTQNERYEVPSSAHYGNRPNDVSATCWARLSRSVNVQLLARKNGEGLDGHETGSHGDSRLAIGYTVDKVRDTAKPIVGHVEIEPSTAEPFTADQRDEEEDQAGQLHPSNSRSSRWLLKLSKRQATRCSPNIHKQEISQTSSAFVECDSNSARRTNSTKSSGAEDPARVYQDCLRMPGSFDGSRWANRRSKVLWDLCTSEDDY